MLAIDDTQDMTDHSLFFPTPRPPCSQLGAQTLALEVACLKGTNVTYLPELQHMD